MREPAKIEIELTEKELKDKKLEFVVGADRQTLDPDAPRTFKRRAQIFNEYEYDLCERAAKIDGRDKAAFIRVAWLEKAQKLILSKEE